MPRKKPTWHTKDLDWDQDGNLYIKDALLAEQIYKAIWNANDPHHPFQIVRDDPDWEGTGGGGGPKQNMQCPC